MCCHQTSTKMAHARAADAQCPRILSGGIIGFGSRRSVVGRQKKTRHGGEDNNACASSPRRVSGRRPCGDNAVDGPQSVRSDRRHRHPAPSILRAMDRTESGTVTRAARASVVDKRRVRGTDVSVHRDDGRLTVTNIS